MRIIIPFQISQVNLKLNLVHLLTFHVRIHSETNIFRYDENITFATQELMPCIDSYRDAHARCEPYPDEKLDGNVASTSERNPFNPDWRQSVSVTYSFADGSAARSHAIQASLRPYRPTYFHFWQLKTFWHETKITDEDIEVHSFEGESRLVSSYLVYPFQCVLTTILFRIILLKRWKLYQPWLLIKHLRPL